MATSATPRYASYRFPAEIISHAVWLCSASRSAYAWWVNCRPRGISVSYETVRQRVLKFGQVLAN